MAIMTVAWIETRSLPLPVLTPLHQFFKFPSNLFPSDSRQVVRVQLEGGHLRLFISHAVALHLLLRFKHAVIVVRDNANKSRQPLIPRKQHFGSANAARIFGV